MVEFTTGPNLFEYDFNVVCYEQDVAVPTDSCGAVAAAVAAGDLSPLGSERGTLPRSRSEVAVTVTGLTQNADVDCFVEVGGGPVGFVSYCQYAGLTTTPVTWSYVGSAGFSAGSVAYTSLALDSSGVPYVAYRDGANSNKATVMKYDSGSVWVPVGSAGFSADAVGFTSLALDSNNVPYVAYTDVANGFKATVMKYDGSAWVPVGSAGFSAGDAYSTSLALDSNNVPYVAYQDGSNSFKATVMKYDSIVHVPENQKPKKNRPFRVARSRTDLATEDAGD